MYKVDGIFSLLCHYLFYFLYHFFNRVTSYFLYHRAYFIRLSSGSNREFAGIEIKKHKLKVISDVFDDERFS